MGSALVKALLKEGHAVRVLDDNSRGAPRRLKEVENDIDFIPGDIRNPATVIKSVRRVDELHHLAFVNVTDYFYSAPEHVLALGVDVMCTVLDACPSGG